MKAAIRGSYVEVVFFMGINERYPLWFEQELYNNIFMDSDRYTFWVPHHERRVDFYEKTLVEDYSVFIRKPNGDIHVTDYDAFTDLYHLFRLDNFTNSGLAALQEDTIDYVECHGGELTRGYPEWFEQHFSEAVNIPQEDETIFFYSSNYGDVEIVVKDDSIFVSVDGSMSITSRCVFLCNKYGEIRGISWGEFVRFYDPDPDLISF